MLQVGKPGDISVIEIQDLLFTNVGLTAGLVMMEWNIAQSSAGSAAMWGKKIPLKIQNEATPTDI
jgi:hypothetical protein